MKALVKAQACPGIWMQDVPVPDYAPDEVLIRVHKTAICGTDIHIYNWDQWAQETIQVPLIIGHEFYGEIVALGSQVKGLCVGDFVSGEGHIVCGHCRNCRAGKRHLCRNTIGLGVNRPGCFAEYLALPASNVFSLPQGFPGEQAAILDPFGNAAHSVLSFDVVGEDVLITGAGPIGLMAARIARHAGARHIVITDVNEFRLNLAREMGVTLAVDPRKENLTDVMRSLGMVEGFDLGFEMSGNPTAFNELLAAMNHGGRVALLGIPPPKTAIDWNHVIFKSLLIKGIYGRELFETWYKMIAMLQSGLDIRPVITHRFAIDDYQEAFECMASGQSGKVILNWVS